VIFFPNFWDNLWAKIVSCGECQISKYFISMARCLNAQLQKCQLIVQIKVYQNNANANERNVEIVRDVVGGFKTTATGCHE
jgi:hypothetical protein